MKFSAILKLIFCLCPLIASAQIPQKLSIGIQGGVITPTSITFSGEQPIEFKPGSTTDLSKSAFLQYEFSKDFFVRGTLKSASYALLNQYRKQLSDTLKFGGDYGVNFNSKQLELSFGYKRSITQRWQLTGSLGLTYLDMKRTGNQDFHPGLPDPREPFWVYQAPIVVKERSILTNVALGLEYKTRRENVFSLELGYYKGFETVANYNFKISERFSQFPDFPLYESSLSTKGDYAEIRLGYRMPLQKFTNFYKAINTPRVNPEPDSVKNQRFIGKYWGLETGKQTFYANQVHERLGYTEKTQVAATWTPYLTFYKGYQFKSRLSLEAGIRIGASNIANTEIGRTGGGDWSMLTLTTPVSVKYALPILRNKLFLSPEMGLWQSYAYAMGSTDYIIKMNGEAKHLKGYGHDYFVGYHAGLSLNGRIGKTSEIGVGYRFANRFTNKPLMSVEPDYDHTLEPLSRIISKSNLKNDMVTISFRKFIRKK